jgi:hypothetical protein
MENVQRVERPSVVPYVVVLDGGGSRTGLVVSVESVRLGRQSVDGAVVEALPALG